MTRLRDAKGPSMPADGGSQGGGGNSGHEGAGSIGQGGTGGAGSNRQAQTHSVGQVPGITWDLEEGDKVKHERFGEGEVVSIEGESPNTTALINFRTAGTKKLLLRFAKLTRL